MSRFPKETDSESDTSAGRHRFSDLDGTDTHGHQVIFPILKQAEGNSFNLIGTGFFISSYGLFVSAKHVIRDCFDDKGNQKYPICTVHFLPGNRYVFRHILWCSSHDSADVAVGFVEPTSDYSLNALLRLTTLAPSIGETIVTYVYPKTKIEQVGTLQVMNFKPAFYDGRLIEYFPNGRDKVMLPDPCYQTSMVILGGASGGPVVGKSGRVFAINSTGYDGTDISFVSRIDEIIYLKLPRFKLPDGQDLHSVTIFDLAKAGWIDLEAQLTGE